MSTNNSKQFNIISWCAGLVFTLSALIVSADELPPLTKHFTVITPRLPIAEIKLQDIDDEVFTIKDLKGKVVVVNFWATWCPPCRREMTSLEKLYQATKDKNVTVVAIDIGEDTETIFSFVNSIDPSPSFPIILDTDAKVMEKWGVAGLPTTFVIDPDGKIAYKAIGGRKFDHPEIIASILELGK